MNFLKYLSISLIIGLCVFSCDKKDEEVQNVIEVTGTIQKQGITTYQYGSHTITGYALRSSVVELDDYVNQSVTLTGKIIEGYPVDGGPEYLEVESIR